MARSNNPGGSFSTNGRDASSNKNPTRTLEVRDFIFYKAVFRTGSANNIQDKTQAISGNEPRIGAGSDGELCQ